MDDQLHLLSICIEFGKVNCKSNYPPNMIGQNGAIELTNSLLQNGAFPKDVLNIGLLNGMQRVGEKFKEGKIFLPEVLISAKAMSSSMELLKPYFQSGEIKFKGKVIMGTVAGDLHDIGKNIVKMVLEGGGWEVIDLGVNVSADKFIESIKEHSVKIVGLSALLTTTMQNMSLIIKNIKEAVNDTYIIIGGAPVSKSFADSINADEYFSDPQAMLEFLNNNFVK